MNVQLSTLPIGVLIALGILAIAELVLDIVALVDLYRRPAQNVTGPSKWIWVVIIVLVNLLGAILYFAVGRKSAPHDNATDRPTAPSKSPTEIADALYPRDDEDPTA
jgi:hypothetical protein